MVGLFQASVAKTSLRRFQPPLFNGYNLKLVALNGVVISRDSPCAAILTRPDFSSGYWNCPISFEASQLVLSGSPILV